MSTQPAETAVVHPEVRRVRVDLRSLVLYFIFTGGKFGILKKNFPGGHFKAWKEYPKEVQMEFSYADLETVRQRLLDEGIVREDNRQIDTGGTMGTFYALADDVVLST